MKLGLALPYNEAGVSVDIIRRLAQTAEELGFDSLWALERDVFPSSRTCSGIADESARDAVRDPLAALALAAAGTERIRVGLSVVNVPFHSPVTLATNLSALDRLSNGRVQLGVGIGYSEYECRTVKSTLESRTPVSEFVEAFESLWAGSTAGYQRDYYFIPRGAAIPEPVQRPSPPVSLVAFAPAAVLPAATLVRGSVEIASQSVPSGMVKNVAGCMKESSTCSRKATLAVRARIVVTAEPIDTNRAMFHGSPSQVKTDIALANAYGVHELMFDPGDMDGDGDLMWALSAMQMIRDMVGAQTRPLVASV